MSCKCKSCKCNNGESHSIPLQLQLQLTGFDEKNDMTDKQPDLWFSFVRAHRAMIRKIEAKLSEAGLPVYAWYDVLWGLESGENGTRRMHELADVLVIERYNLTRLMDRLEKSGWSRVFDRMTIAGPPSRLSPRKARPCGKRCGRSTVRWSTPTFSTSSAKKGRTLLRRVEQCDAAGQRVIRHRA